ncbi:MAG: hypothetical protein ABI232_01835, partial [Jatrophihabitantaceae bacterium]
MTFGDVVPELPVVKFSEVFASNLALLTTILDEPNVNLATAVEQLAADSKLAVHAFLGLSIVITIGDRRVALTARESASPTVAVRSSLQISFPATTFGESSNALNIVLYGSKPGAFIDLA